MTDEAFADRAAEVLVAELELPAHADVADIRLTLSAHVHSGHDKAVKALLEALPNGEWRWPRYVDHVPRQQAAYHAEDVREIQGMKPADLLMMPKAPQLRAMHKIRIGRPPPGLKPPDLVAALARVFTSDDYEALRRDLLDDLVAADNIDERDMASAARIRFGRLAHQFERVTQLLNPDLLSISPYWKLKALSDPDCDCTPFDGTVKHWEDPFWATHMPLCEVPWCAAYLSAQRER